jgi:enoyl-CoA hydratase/carnithine racemase
MTDREYVHVNVTDRVALLEIDHPPLNELDEPTFKALESALDQAMADERVKVIVITGKGRSFIAGAGIGELQAISNPDEARDRAQSGHDLLHKVERSPKPVIAAINGRYCLGGGNELAMACHFRIAEEKVKFGQPEIKLGIIPGWGGTQRLPRLVGVAKAIELILTGDPIRAKEAHRVGLVNKVVPEGTGVQAAMRLAKRLSSLSGPALARSLDAIYAGVEMSLDKGIAYEAGLFGELANTDDKREGLEAFVQGRRPEFRDQ